MWSVVSLVLGTLLFSLPHPAQPAGEENPADRFLNTAGNAARQSSPPRQFGWLAILTTIYPLAASRLSGKVRRYKKIGVYNVFNNLCSLVVRRYAPLPAHERFGKPCAINASGYIGHGLSGLGLRMLFSVGRAPAIEWF